MMSVWVWSGNRSRSRGDILGDSLLSGRKREVKKGYFVTDREEKGKRVRCPICLNGELGRRADWDITELAPKLSAYVRRGRFLRIALSHCVGPRNSLSPL